MPFFFFLFFHWPWEKTPPKPKTTAVSESCSNVEGKGSFFMKGLYLSCASFPACPRMVRYELGHMAVYTWWCYERVLKPFAFDVFMVTNLWLQSLPMLYFNPLSIQDSFYQVFPSVVETIIDCYKSVGSGILSLDGVFLTQRLGWVS